MKQTKKNDIFCEIFAQSVPEKCLKAVRSQNCSAALHTCKSFSTQNSRHRACDQTS